MARAKKPADDARARTFPALPPAPGRRSFASSWWGGEWIAALEETSMDSGRLSRGRTYARHGAVGEITVSPGRITAKVHGSQPRPYTSSVRIRVLDDREWDRLVDTVAAKGVHIAALLERDMPQGLADDAAGAGVHLLPHGNELEPECSCPDWGYPCKHAAALCYQIARILDEDPFVLLLMRGRDETAIKTGLQRRNAAHAAVEQAEVVMAARQAPAGVPARDAFAAWALSRDPAPLVGPVPSAGSPAVLDTPTPPAGIDPQALAMLAADAAARAKALLDTYLVRGSSQGCDPAPLVPMLDAHRDAVRMLAGEHRDVHVFARLVEALDVDPSYLSRGILAWRYGGAAGFDILEVPWTPPPADLARARTLLEAGRDADEPPTLKPWRNRWTFADRDLQLRYGRDGRWHPYRQRGGAWWPVGPPSRDPSELLTALQ
jgi:uncharacterized Zn finger protein